MKAGTSSVISFNVKDAVGAQLSNSQISCYTLSVMNGIFSNYGNAFESTVGSGIYQLTYTPATAGAVQIQCSINGDGTLIPSLNIIVN
jgi:hypothetical protein